MKKAKSLAIHLLHLFIVSFATDACCQIKDTNALQTVEISASRLEFNDTLNKFILANRKKWKLRNTQNQYFDFFYYLKKDDQLIDSIKVKLLISYSDGDYLSLPESTRYHMNDSIRFWDKKHLTLKKMNLIFSDNVLLDNNLISTWLSNKNKNMWTSRHKEDSLMIFSSYSRYYTNDSVMIVSTFKEEQLISVQLFKPISDITDFEYRHYGAIYLYDEHGMLQSITSFQKKIIDGHEFRDEFIIRATDIPPSSDAISKKFCQNNF